MLAFVLLMLALAINTSNPKMLALSLIVGASVFLPVPNQSYLLFYGFCIVSESVVLLCALVLRTNASLAIASICVGLIISHVLGMKLDGYPPLSPYRIIVPILEHVELLACILLSNPLIGKLRNYEPSPIG